MNKKASAALLVAASKGDLEGVRLRLAQGADVNARAPRTKSTALFEAIRHGNRSMITCCLRAGADVSLTDAEGCGPLWLATYKRDAPTVKRLLALRAPIEVDPNPLEAAIEAGHLKTAQLLLAAGAKVSGRHLLTKAARVGSVAQVSALLQAGLGRELEQRDPNGWTPLLAALTNRHWATAEALLRAGAKLHSKAGRGSPLVLARERGGEAAVERLQAVSKRSR